MNFAARPRDPHPGMTPDRRLTLMRRAEMSAAPRPTLFAAGRMMTAADRVPSVLQREAQGGDDTLLSGRCGFSGCGA